MFRADAFRRTYDWEGCSINKVCLEYERKLTRENDDTKDGNNCAEPSICWTDKNHCVEQAAFVWSSVLNSIQYL
jgi:hypothetical protein